MGIHAEVAAFTFCRVNWWMLFQGPSRGGRGLSIWTVCAAFDRKREEYKTARSSA